jgi:hypothetical protein
VPTELDNTGAGEYQLEELLNELGVNEAYALCEWYNCTACDLEDVVALAHCQVQKLTCDNCRAVWYRVHPPGDDWGPFQGCDEPHEQGFVIERPRGDIEICNGCYARNPAFLLLV